MGTSPNVAVTPSFNTSVGYPNQFKMGDYITIVSGETAAQAAFTATLNGEQDVYHVRLFPDCNGNGVSDVLDVASPVIFDCNANHVPDECELAVCLGAGTVPAASPWTSRGTTSRWSGRVPAPAARTTMPSTRARWAASRATRRGPARRGARRRTR